MNRYFIDGYNLLFHVQSRKNLQTRRRYWLEFINARCRTCKLDLVVVFDGDEEGHEGHFDTLKVVYTAKGESADLWILKELQSTSKGVVVTKDRELAQQAKLYNASTMSPEAFLSWIKKRHLKNMNFGFCRTLDDGKAPRTSDRGQVNINEYGPEWERWQRIFMERLEKIRADPHRDR